MNNIIHTLCLLSFWRWSVWVVLWTLEFGELGYLLKPLVDIPLQFLCYGAFMKLYLLAGCQLKEKMTFPIVVLQGQQIPWAIT